MNDPRNPQLELADPDRGGLLPYIRMEGNDHWNIRRVCIRVAIEGFNECIAFAIRLDPQGLWLGNKSGKICYVPLAKPGVFICKPDPEDKGQDWKGKGGE